MKKIAGLVFVLLVQWAAAQNIIYVDALATGNNTGTSWGNAYPDLQLGLEAAQYGDEIWVAKATYFPSKDTGNTANPGDPRRKYFCLVDGVGIYGGFDGTETQRSQRDWLTNFTVLSGDLGVKGDSSDNSYHVVASINDNLGPESILDGFIVEKGNADKNSFVDPRYGGGIHIWGPSRAVLKNLIIRDNIGNSGGGLGFVDSLGGKSKSGYISVVNCRIRNNHSTHRGGGIFMYENRASFINCLIANNNVSSMASSAGVTGGAGHLSGSKVKLYNCTVSDNESNGSSNTYGFYLAYTYKRVYNSFMMDKGSGRVNTNNAESYNCIFYFDTIPGFIDSSNYRLQYSSPARDAGLDSLLPNDVADLDEDGDTSETIPFDILNRSRSNGGRVDIGAFEYRPAWVDSSARTICGEHYYFDGQFIDSAGTYVKVNAHNSGDSLQFLTLIFESVEAWAYYDTSSGEFVSFGTADHYQWISCGHDSVLPGDTLPYFNPTENGSYALVVSSDSGCSDTSACFTINNVALPGEELTGNMSLYPNPARDVLRLRMNQDFPPKGFVVKVYDLSGKQVYHQRFDHYREKEINIPLHNLKKGMYALKIGEEVLRFVKE